MPGGSIGQGYALSSRGALTRGALRHVRCPLTSFLVRDPWGSLSLSQPNVLEMSQTYVGASPVDLVPRRIAGLRPLAACKAPPGSFEVIGRGEESSTRRGRTGTPSVRVAAVSAMSIACVRAGLAVG